MINSPIVNFAVYINGSPTDITAFRSLRINKSINQPDRAEINIIDDTDNPYDLPFPIFNSNIFKTGASIAIHPGYDDKLSEVFAGTWLIR